MASNALSGEEARANKNKLHSIAVIACAYIGTLWHNECLDTYGVTHT